MTRFLKWVFPDGSLGHWLLSSNRWDLAGILLCLIKSFRSTRRLTGRCFPVRVRVGPHAQFIVAPCRKACVEMSGVISCDWSIGDRSPSSLDCGDGATLRVLGDFAVGPGVHVRVGRGATLEIGGRQTSTASGITGDGLVLVEEYVRIGADSIVGPRVFISDSDWHDLAGSERHVPVQIGDHVWIGHGASIMKGAVIESGCVVGAGAVVTNAFFPADSVITGNPAAIRRSNVQWSR